MFRSKEEAAPVIVVGLGNPGPEYEKTRHNAGRMTVEELARRLGATDWRTKAGCNVVETTYAGKKVVLATPDTYMNTSGGPVSKLLKRLGATPADLIVVHDELDIPAGDVRVKIGGGAGGHNGLKSLFDKLQTKDFVRVRVGIGRPPGSMDPADFVLRQLKGKALDEQLETVDEAANAVESILEHGAVAARDEFNGRHRG